MIAQNLTYEAVKRGATALFISASEMLNDLAAQEGTTSLQRRLSRYSRPQLLTIDLCGVLGYVESPPGNLSSKRNRRA